MDFALRKAAGAEGAKFSAPRMVQVGLGQNRARGVAGAEEEDVEGFFVIADVEVERLDERTLGAKPPPGVRKFVVWP